MTLKIGLTGGIGSGKSTAAKYFAKFKIPVIDADKIVHKLLKPKTLSYKKIVAHFGKNFLTANQHLDRVKIRVNIFSNPKERIWIEKLLHPQVRTIMQKQVAKIKKPYCIMAIPLLFETKFPIKVDRTLVIDCPIKTQIKRVHKQSNATIKQIQNIIKTQANRNFRLKKADDIICNKTTLKNLKKEVKKLHLHYLSLT